MRRRYFIAFVFLGVATLAVQAQPYGPGWGRGPGPYPGAAAVDTPEALVRGAIAKLLEFSRSESSEDRMAAIAFLEREIAQHVDFDAMTRAAAGPLYRQMSAAQRNETRSRIKEHFLTTLASGLIGYDLRDIRVARSSRDRRGRGASVSVYLRQPRGLSTRLDFRFYPSRLGWKVYDVSANGRSATLFYRDLIRRTSGRRWR